MPSYSLHFCALPLSRGGESKIYDSRKCIAEQLPCYFDATSARYPECREIIAQNLEKISQYSSVLQNLNNNTSVVLIPRIIIKNSEYAKNNLSNIQKLNLFTIKKVKILQEKTLSFCLENSYEYTAQHISLLLYLLTRDINFDNHNTVVSSIINQVGFGDYSDTRALTAFGYYLYTKSPGYFSAGQYLGYTGVATYIRENVLKKPDYIFHPARDFYTSLSEKDKQFVKSTLGFYKWE